MPLPGHSKGGLLAGLFLPGLLVIIGVAAYSNSFSGPFIFDDVPNIVENPNIRSIWPLTKAMSAPDKSGLGGRPILSLSFSLNYAFGGYNVLGYHIVNLAIHILAALILYAIVRRTLLSDRLKERFGGHSAVLALIIAAVWLAHPIQTESVTYIVQRAESLMGLFYLFTVYTAIRTMQPNHSKIWPVLSVVFCAFGMVTKEVTATAPVMILLYDRAFAGGTFVSALKKRLPLYVGLAATWVVLAVGMAYGAARSDTIGFSVHIKPFDYLMNQAIAIVKYLELCFWPDKLCIYYSWPVIKIWRLILPSLGIIAVLIAVTLLGLVKNRAWSYPAVWFFAILAPTSSFVPIADIIFEHRVYLSLAGLTTMVVVPGYYLLRMNSGRARKWLGLGVALVIVVALTVRTFYRNEDYKSELLIWQSVVEAAPTSYKGYNNLGNEFKKQGKIEQAIGCFLKALTINPDYINAHLNLGKILKSQGRLSESSCHYLQILHKDPNHIEANFNLGVVFHLQNKLDQAVDYYHRTLKLDPNHIDAQNNLGAVLVSRGSFDEAEEHFNGVLNLYPNNTKAENNLAYALISRPGAGKEDIDRAVAFARRAAEANDFNDPEVLDTLADCYSKQGNTELAVQTAKKALDLAEAAGNKQLAESIRDKLLLYKKQTP
jgi:tetratricopeptide (TPR) repeat protein